MWPPRPTVSPPAPSACMILLLLSSPAGFAQGFHHSFSDGSRVSAMARGPPLFVPPRHDVASATKTTAKTTTKTMTTTELPSTSVHPDGGGKHVDPPIVIAVQDLFRHLDGLYDRSSSIRCPFFRRRAADAVDAAAMVARFLLIRHKSLGILDPLWDLADEDSDAMASSDALKPPGCKAVGVHVRERNADGTVRKRRGLPLADVAESVRRDWTDGRADGTGGYYITGRLNSTLYADDCLFEGPDPDMPVRGLRKYLSAASHLFDPRTSSAELLDLSLTEGGGKTGRGVVVARWRLEGTLMLPWRPAVRPWTGTTQYHLGEDGLIYLHEEEWDISVWEAFVCTVWPEVGERIWKTDASSAGDPDTH